MRIDWSAAVIDELRVLVSQHHSAREIARRLGTTRNAVIGKCAREGLKLGGYREPTQKPTSGKVRQAWTLDQINRLHALWGARTPIMTMVAELGRSQLAVERKLTQLGYRRIVSWLAGMPSKSAKVKETIASFAEKEIPEPSRGGEVRFIDATDRQCRWIVDDPRRAGIETRCCGQPIIDGLTYRERPYCIAHTLRATPIGQHVNLTDADKEARARAIRKGKLFAAAKREGLAA